MSGDHAIPAVPRGTQEAEHPGLVLAWEQGEDAPGHFELFSA